jgi:hypothetical protein
MKVLLLTPTYRRPYMLRQCILNAKNQSYTDFTHSISIMYDDVSEVANYESLFDDILDDRFIIGYNKNSSSLARYMTTLLQCPTPYDIYIKIDDDDIYKRDYVKTVVEYFDTHECDVLSSQIGYQLNNYFLSKGDYRTFCGDTPINNYLMPQTFAFSHKAYQIMLNINDNQDHEDRQLRSAWFEAGLKADIIDNSNNIVWHIHGKNTVIPHWFRPS